MVAGDPFLRSYSDTLAQRAVSHVCIGGTAAEGETPGFPKNNCPQGFRAQVFFPSCWDGKNLDSPDHKSHMAYPSGMNGGKCPPTHPTKLISVFAENWFNVDEWKDQWYDGKWPFVFANGDSTGYGFHGDFVNGWDPKVLQKAVDDCDDRNGDAKKCPHFTFWEDSKTDDCMLAPRIKEQTSGWMKALPGCNPVTSGPGRAAPGGTACGATTTIGEPEVYSSDMTSKGWEYVGCALDKNNDRTLPLRHGDPQMTIEKCIDFCVSKGKTYAGLEFANECYCGDSVAQDRLGYQKCMTPCAGNPKQYCGAGGRLSVYRKGTGTPKPPTTPTTSTRTTAKPTATPTPTPKPSTTSKPVSSPTPTPTPGTGTGIKLPTGWVSLGCHTDPLNPRALANKAYFQVAISSGNCAAHCASKGFAFAGTEYGGECFCGNSIDGGAKAPDSECNMPCEGDAKQMCGAARRLSLFGKKPPGGKKRRAVVGGGSLMRR